MLLRYGNVIFIIAAVFILVVQSLKFGTPRFGRDSISSEIKRNISAINHELREMVRKYAEYKTRDGILQRLIEDKHRLKINTNDDTIKEHSNYEVRAKTKPSSRKPVETTTYYYSDKSSETGEVQTHKEKHRYLKEIHDARVNPPGSEENQSIIKARHRYLKQIHDEKDNSPEPEENQSKLDERPIRIPALYLQSQNEDTSLERNEKHKKALISHKSKIKNHDSKLSKEIEDVEKVLVIHLGDKQKMRVQKKTTSNFNQVSVQTTVTIQLPTTTKSRPEFKSETPTHDDSDIEDDIEMKKVILRAVKLRQSYNNACTSLVSKKCIRALGEVLRDICKTSRKCTEAFNSDFAANSEIACYREFGSTHTGYMKYRSKHERNVSNKNSGSGSVESGDNKKSETNKKAEPSEDKFVDFTRQGFFDMTCLHTLSNVKESHVQRTEDLTPDGKPKEVNVLRNEYEKACKKACFDKCTAACKNATDTTCVKHECISKKISALRQSCKRRCGDTYGTAGDSSSSESESESDSDDSD